MIPTPDSRHGENTDPVRSLTFAAAIGEGIAALMSSDPAVFCAGPDMTLGGAFGGFDGLRDRFGAGRVVDTPQGQQGLAGLGVGAAVAGLRPLIELPLMDFLLTAIDQIANRSAETSRRSTDRAPLPLTIVTTADAEGGSIRRGQSLEAMLCHVPGLTVVMPSNPTDAKGLMVASVRSDQPVVYIAHRRLLATRGPCPRDRFETPIGEATVIRPGRDVTIVTWGRMVHEALRAASVLAADGVEAEIVDLRTLQPLDMTTVLASVARTNNCVVVHDAVRFGGLGAEVAAQVQEYGFDDLDAPVGRVGAPFCPAPSHPGPSDERIPDAAAIAADVRAALHRLGD